MIGLIKRNIHDKLKFALCLTMSRIWNAIIQVGLDLRSGPFTLALCEICVCMQRDNYFSGHFLCINFSQINRLMVQILGNKYRCFVRLTAVVWANPMRLTDAWHFPSSIKWEVTAYLTSPEALYRPILQTICQVK